MIRNLKILGVALAAVFALSAVVASAASAAEQAFLTSDGPVTLTGTETGEKANRLTAFGTFTECPNSTYTGHKFNVTPHQFVEAHTTTVTITPKYINCFSSALKFATTVDMEECDYVFHLLETTETPTDTYGVLATVNCPTNHHIKVTTTIGGKLCTTTITENAAGYKGLDITDTTTGEIDIGGAIKGIKADQKGPGCPKGEVEQTEEGAELILDITVIGDNNLGEKTEIGISEEKETTSHI